MPFGIRLGGSAQVSTGTWGICVTKTLRAIGLMSGTSMDGVDVAMIETDGEQVTAFGPLK